MIPKKHAPDLILDLIRGGYRFSEKIMLQYRAGNAVGSGGEIAFNFKARKAGTGEIALKHWRHWEGDRSVIARFRVRLNVQA